MYLAAGGSSDIAAVERPPAPQPLWVNIDEADGRDHLACSHIANDIMNHLFRAEVRIRNIVHRTYGCPLNAT